MQSNGSLRGSEKGFRSCGWKAEGKFLMLLAVQHCILVILIYCSGEHREWKILSVRILYDDTKSRCSPCDISISLREMNGSVVFFLIIKNQTKITPPKQNKPPYLGHRHLTETSLPSPRGVMHILWTLFHWSTKLYGEANAGNSDMNPQLNLWQLGHLAAVRGQLGLNRGYN